MQHKIINKSQVLILHAPLRRTLGFVIKFNKLILIIKCVVAHRSSILLRGTPFHILRNELWKHGPAAQATARKQHVVKPRQVEREVVEIIPVAIYFGELPIVPFGSVANRWQL